MYSVLISWLIGVILDVLQPEESCKIRMVILKLLIALTSLQHKWVLGKIINIALVNTHLIGWKTDMYTHATTVEKVPYIKNINYCDPTLL